ncbi:hypothetical protein THRCLA_02544 [Thraustotheca clavata]|uniref:Uncharacterized protein n=1 Tax=Thraustotheca clavata TaxID=74557 RepID=A0A1W0A558_9STRA|nr:hypothetical protein THRCLA_02544 [Thraustotheca clavata]
MERKRITLVSIGSRGDVQPFCVLGRALADRGYKVAIATEKRLENLVVNEFRLPYRYIAGDTNGILLEPTYQKQLTTRSTRTLLKLGKQWKAKFNIDEILASYVIALEESDIIVSSSACLSETYAIAEQLNAAWIPFILTPMQPTKEFPLWMMGNITLGFKCLNLWSYNFFFKQMWKNERKYINQWRQQVLKLPQMKSSLGTIDFVNANERIPILIGSSKLFCGNKRSVPGDYDRNKVHLFGPVFASPSLLPEEVALFITGARTVSMPIVYIGFGNMPTDKPLELLKMALDVCTLAYCRAIVVAAWPELGSHEAISLLNNNAESLIVVDNVSHTTLFPKVDCILHHCGIGTCNTALLSGIPQIPCPARFDQPGNAKVLVNLGVAFRARPFQSLTAKQIAADVDNILVNTKDIQNRAKEVATLLRQECTGALDEYCDVISDAFPLREHTYVEEED